ncbi:hypothetical protein TSAR_002522 [Trichomalopsis sarcophagae]|uniref:Uncharacterized protein n=1 Tax=Trichomalopsis sarcophagae TaxID=543379 RepID=A0A232EV17_9HYME|nr:hypothetical protein TSAR_002522 [Trichomalopsis sarcophagae]
MIKWRGSATKASLRSRRSRGSCDTIYFYIGVRIFHLQKKCLSLLSSLLGNLSRNSIVH